MYINNKIYSYFRKKILERNGYTCQICWNKGNIVHHKKEKSINPDMIFDKDNVITVCGECHKKTENFLNQNRQHRGLKSVIFKENQKCKMSYNVNIRINKNEKDKIEKIKKEIGITDGVFLKFAINLAIEKLENLC